MSSHGIDSRKNFEYRSMHGHGMVFDNLLTLDAHATSAVVIT